MRPIDADKLPEHKFTRESAKGSDYMRGWNDAIDAIVDNAPPIETTIENLISTLSVEELKATTRFKVDTPSGEVISFRREKTGEWIGGEIGHCSICGSEGCASDIWNGCKDGMYCPNCGAAMRGEENE